MRRRDLFLQVLEQVRQRYGWVVLGYVVMPNHFHLLVSEPQDVDGDVRLRKTSYPRSYLRCIDDIYP